jgi:hypothetical protein
LRRIPTKFISEFCELFLFSAHFTKSEMDKFFTDTSKFRSLEHVGGLISAAPKERSWRVAGDWEWRRGLTGRKGGTVGDLRGGR